MSEMKEYKEGEVSEWNEGNFKSLRLHQAQDLMNRAKIFPLKKFGIEPDSKFNYEIWFDSIIILFGEGSAKYSEKEYDEVCLLQEEVTDIMEKNPPCSLKKSYINGDYHKVTSVNQKRWKDLKKKIEEFEYKVKSYNDKHGLSTRNVGTKGMF